MKLHAFLLTLCVSLSFSSCLKKADSKNQPTDTRTVLPSSTGNFSELVIVISDELWQGGLGEILKSSFQESIKAIPQQEALFDIYAIEPKDFSSIFQTHKNILWLSVGDKVAVERKDEKWAKNQLYVYIQHKTEEQLIKQLQERVYEIREWFLDKGRQHPQLKIHRRQLPLTPAFGMTTHSARGQTFSNGAIVDLCIGGSSSTMSSYVALTRVERREDLLILRPFPLDMFSRGQKPGMELLLRTWRGDKDIVWPTIEKEHMPCKRCPTCGHIKLKKSFTETEFKRLDDNDILVGSCKMCQAERKSRRIALAVYILFFLSCGDRFSIERKALENKF